MEKGNRLAICNSNERLDISATASEAAFSPVTLWPRHLRITEEKKKGEKMRNHGMR